MIDAITSPGMAIDIRLSTQEPVQQLGARLAHILSGELSRMRADLAFASATGIAVHSSLANAESLRAQQSTLLGHHQLSLTTQTALHSDSALRSRSQQALGNYADEQAHKYRYKAEKDGTHPQSQSQDEPESEPGETLDSMRNEANSVSTIEHNDALVRAIQDALAQFQVLTQESGISGTPMAIVLPADYWLEQYAPAGLQPSKMTGNACNESSVLVLCLAFDGDLAQEKTVWGFAYQHSQCVGSAHGRWSENIPVQLNDQWILKVTDPESLVSHLSCKQGGLTDKSADCMSGLRIRSEEQEAEYGLWSWQIMEWTWH